MKKTIRIVGLMLVAVISLGLLACGGDDDVLTPPKQQEKQEEQTETPASYQEMVATPLTLEALANGTITFSNNADGPVIYRIDGGNAQTIESYTDVDINVTTGQKVAFYGNNATYATGASFVGSRISCDVDFYVYGNIMSLVKSTDFSNATVLTASHTFAGLFSLDDKLKNSPSKILVLPATTLTESCYYNMFGGCLGLTTAPALPATKLADYCYFAMFSGCFQLKVAPELPATDLANECYNAMFSNCTSLTVAPTLPATELADDCYHSMFSSCTSLTTAPALPATKMLDRCYSGMFYGCTALKTAPSLPATTLAYNCYGSMFYGCTELTEAPSLPAKTLADWCYYEMFKGCTKLSKIRCMATSFASKSTKDWVQGVRISGKFTKDANANWSSGSSGIPSGWTVESN